MCRNVKIKLTYLKVRLLLRFVRSLRTIRGCFRRFAVGVVPPLERSGRPVTSQETHTLCVFDRLPVVSWRRAKCKQMYGLKSTLTVSR